MSSIDTKNLSATIDQINTSILEVRAVKSTHPELKLGLYEGNVGSLLNAYREGDLSFDECTERLIPRQAVAKALAGAEESLITLIDHSIGAECLYRGNACLHCQNLIKVRATIAALGLPAAKDK